ncbi:MAG: hypothetical protein ACRCT8_09255 [Lacipirellulaceae bacterium]
MRVVFGLVLACTVTLAPMALAQGPAAGGSLLDPGPAPTDEGAAQRKIDYERSTVRATPTMIIQQKAQMRAADRMSRIAALEWYGQSKARPQTLATPFSGLYGNQFQGHSYGRPNAWQATRPVVLITR